MRHSNFLTVNNAVQEKNHEGSTEKLEHDHLHGDEDNHSETSCKTF